MRHSAYLLSASLVVACGGCRGVKEPALPRRLAPRPADAPRFVVVLLDSSDGMRRSDPGRHGELASQLILALMNEGSHFGAIAFGRETWVLSDAMRVDAAWRPAALKTTTYDIQRWGAAGPAAAAKRARAMIEKKIPANASGSVVLVTDSLDVSPGARASLERELGFLVEKGWPLHVMGFSADAAKTGAGGLAEVVAKTGGRCYDIRDAASLVEAAVDVVSEVEGLFVRTAKEGAFGDAAVMPGTTKLAYVALDGAARSGAPVSIGEATLDGSEPKAKSSHRWPAPGGNGKAGPIRVLSYERPEPGVWAAELAGSPRVAYSLQRPPVAVEMLPDVPKEYYAEGQSVPMGLKAKAESAEAMSAIESKVAGEAALTSEKTRKGLGETALADRFRGKGDEEASGLVMRGAGEASVSDPGSKDPDFVRASVDCLLRLDGDGAEPWRQRHYAWFRVTPVVALFETEPAEFVAGTVWSEGVPVARELKVKVKAGPGRLVPSSDVPGVAFDPWELADVKAEEPRSVTVTFSPAELPSPGRADGAVSLALVLSEEPERPLVRRLPVTTQVVKLEGGDLDLGKHVPGTEISFELPYRTAPASKLSFELEPLRQVQPPPVKPEAEAAPPVETAPPVEAPPAVPPVEAPPVETPPADAPPATEPAPGAAVGKPPVGGEAVEAAAKPEVVFVPDGARIELKVVAGPEGAALVGAIAMEAPVAEYRGKITLTARDVETALITLGPAEAAEPPAVPSVEPPVEAPPVVPPVETVPPVGTPPVGTPPAGTAPPAEGAPPAEAPPVGPPVEAPPAGGEPAVEPPAEPPVAPAEGTGPVTKEDVKPKETRKVAFAELPPRVFEVLLVVKPFEPEVVAFLPKGSAKKPMSSLAIDVAKPGDATTPVKLAIVHVEDGSVSYAMDDLRSKEGGVISSRWCVEMKPGAGWDGKTAVKGEAYDLAVNVYALDDLVNGTYEGKLRLRLTREGAEVAKAEVAVAVKVAFERGATKGVDLLEMELPDLDKPRAPEPPAPPVTEPPAVEPPVVEPPAGP